MKKFKKKITRNSIKEVLTFIVDVASKSISITFFITFVWVVVMDTIGSDWLSKIVPYAFVGFAGVFILAFIHYAIHPADL